MLVAGGISHLAEGSDPEGFSAGAHQFDSDITRGRYPRAALGISQSDLIAVVCDGRGDADAGMTLSELASTMVELGAGEAINLDGGGSASLLVAGELANFPREEHGAGLPGGRAISTAIAFAGR
jgi:exopolysaccharide biosynthesis protein